MIGLIGKKQGMTQVFTDDGNVVPVTIIGIEENIVVGKKIIDKDGYNALVIGSFETNEKKLNKPVLGQFKEKTKLKRVLKEFRVDDPGQYEIGQEIGLEIFENIVFVDVTGTSKGKGFQGVMKRHGFGGGPKTHGSKFHRQNGSTGQSAYPSRGFKGVKRAGRMGNDKVTTQNLKICEVDKENKIVLIKGCVPGVNKGLVFIKKSKKKN
jgi:large subunit ribosomal protein L3